MKKVDLDGWIFGITTASLVVFLFWNLHQGSRINRLEERSDNYIIKVAKVDGVLKVDCWCGNHLYCEDGEKQFMYTCAKCGTIYTNTDCRTSAEFYTFVGADWLND